MPCADPESFVRGGPTLTSVLEGRDDPSEFNYKRAIIGPPAKRHLYGVSLACRKWPKIECWLGSFVFFRGSGPVLLRNPIFCDFPGGPDPLYPPLDPPMNA